MPEPGSEPRMTTAQEAQPDAEGGVRQSDPPADPAEKAAESTEVTEDEALDRA